jgi:hypothetical protein
MHHCCQGPGCGAGGGDGCGGVGDRPLVPAAAGSQRVAPNGDACISSDPGADQLRGLDPSVADSPTVVVRT